MGVHHICVQEECAGGSDDEENFSLSHNHKKRENWRYTTQKKYFKFEISSIALSEYLIG